METFCDSWLYEMLLHVLPLYFWLNCQHGSGIKLTWEILQIHRIDSYKTIFSNYMMSLINSPIIIGENICMLQKDLHFLEVYAWLDV